MKGQNFKIQGGKRTLNQVIEGIISLQEKIAENNYNYGKAWRSWLPMRNDDSEVFGDKTQYDKNGLDKNGLGVDQKGRMAYVPIVARRKVFSEIEGKNDSYFIYILNQGRDQRPKSNVDDVDKHCKLCINILDKGMILSEIDDYYLVPNGYPYHNRTSLLINKNLDRAQYLEIRPEEISTWIKTSILLDQVCFFNSLGAGASIPGHQHVQIVDSTAIKMNEAIPTYPLFNRNGVKHEQVGNSSDVFRVRNYVVDALLFTGYDASNKAVNLTKKLSSDGRAFNIIVNKSDVYVIGRNKDCEVSLCMKRKVGGYEMMGVVLLGDIEEKSGEENITVHGSEVFSNTSFETVKLNISNAATSLEEYVTLY